MLPSQTLRWFSPDHATGSSDNNKVPGLADSERARPSDALGGWAGRKYGWPIFITPPRTSGRNSRGLKSRCPTGLLCLAIRNGWDCLRTRPVFPSANLCFVSVENRSSLFDNQAVCFALHNSNAYCVDSQTTLQASLKTRPERWGSGCELGLARPLDASYSDPAWFRLIPMLRV